MRYVILLSLFCFLGYACSDSEGEKIAPSIKPDAEGTWTDPRNGITYGWVRLGNQEWLTENMRAETAIGNYVAEDDMTDEMF